VDISERLLRLADVFILTSCFCHKRYQQKINSTQPCTHFYLHVEFLSAAAI